MIYMFTLPDEKLYTINWESSAHKLFITYRLELSSHLLDNNKLELDNLKNNTGQKANGQGYSIQYNTIHTYFVGIETRLFLTSFTNQIYTEETPGWDWQPVWLNSCHHVKRQVVNVIIDNKHVRRFI